MCSRKAVWDIDTSIVAKTDLSTEGYKLKVDSNLQYGQKNAASELRFIVYHDEERKPFQVI